MPAPALDPGAQNMKDEIQSLIDALLDNGCFVFLAGEPKRAVQRGLNPRWPPIEDNSYGRRVSSLTIDLGFEKWKNINGSSEGRCGHFLGPYPLGWKTRYCSLHVYDDQAARTDTCS